MFLMYGLAIVLLHLTRNEIVAPIFNQTQLSQFYKRWHGIEYPAAELLDGDPPTRIVFGICIYHHSFCIMPMQACKRNAMVTGSNPYCHGLLFSACVLGVGIMMGGKWAYESLSFGGYWAWDPVENASLVPWLILIAGLHTMVIYKATGHSLRASYLFTILSFVFILYSTFLTRTGVLGDTSVHAFTEAGNAINIMIGIFVLAFTLPMLFLFYKHFNKIPAIHKEEETSSREFWMFIGSLVFFLSALFIIAITSIPVYNKIFNQRPDPQNS